MKRKILWLGLSFLLVAALVLASCGPAAPGEQEEEEEEEPVGEQEEEEEEPAVGEQEEEEEPVVGGPQYGGTLTIFIDAESRGDAASPDPADASNATGFVDFIQERLIEGDFEKYGPRGTDEYGFFMNAFIPLRFLGGVLAESWEVSPEKLVFHIRPGVMWHDNPYLDFDFEPREVTAQDVAADMLYFREGSGAGIFKQMFGGDIYAEDRYTVVLDFTGFGIGWPYTAGYGLWMLISPPEMVVAGADKWGNQVGSGPWMFKEYATGSHMSFIRNPDYWNTTIIDGVEYSLPFVDEVIVVILPDEATAMAALRTGKVDYNGRVEAYHWSLIDETAPEMLSVTVSGAWGRGVALKTTSPPLDNVEVRRALMIGTDLKAYADLYGVGPLPKLWWPVYRENPDIFVPLEEMPADIQILFDYNPDLAKQMLVDAGYPDGFKLTFNTTTLTIFPDRAALLKDMWAKLGVELEIEARDITTFLSRLRSGVFEYASHAGLESADPTAVFSRGYTGAGGLGWAGERANIAEWSNLQYDNLVDKIRVETDATERNRLIKEATLIILREVPYIQTDVAPRGSFWWPWLKNYYGERNVGHSGDVSSIFARIWIDQELKADMGY